MRASCPQTDHVHRQEGHTGAIARRAPRARSRDPRRPTHRCLCRGRPRGARPARPGAHLARALVAPHAVKHARARREHAAVRRQPRGAAVGYQHHVRQVRRLRQAGQALQQRGLACARVARRSHCH